MNAVKAAVVERPHPVDVQLAPCLLAFLSLIADEDRNVRRAAVVALSAVAHHKVQGRGGCLLGGSAEATHFLKFLWYLEAAAPFPSPIISTHASLASPSSPGSLPLNMCRPPNSAQAPLVSGHLPALLPLLYQQTVVRPEMVRVVDLGPFKHTVRGSGGEGGRDGARCGPGPLQAHGEAGQGGETAGAGGGYNGLRGGEGGDTCFTALPCRQRS